MGRKRTKYSMLTPKLHGHNAGDIRASIRLLQSKSVEVQRYPLVCLLLSIQDKTCSLLQSLLSHTGNAPQVLASPVTGIVTLEAYWDLGVAGKLRQRLRCLRFCKTQRQIGNAQTWSRLMHAQCPPHFASRIVIASWSGCCAYL